MHSPHPLRFQNIACAENHVNILIAMHLCPNYRGPMIHLEYYINPPKWLSNYVKANNRQDYFHYAAFNLGMIALLGVGGMMSIAPWMNCVGASVLLVPFLVASSICVAFVAGAVGLLYYESSTSNMYEIEKAFLLGKKQKIKELCGNTHKDDDLGPQVIRQDDGETYRLKLKIYVGSYKGSQDLHFNYEEHKPLAQR